LGKTIDKKGDKIQLNMNITKTKHSTLPNIMLTNKTLTMLYTTMVVYSKRSCHDFDFNPRINLTGEDLPSLDGGAFDLLPERVLTRLGHTSTP